MENISYASIEEYGFTASLYNKLKRAGVNFVHEIPGFHLNRLLKSELIELLTEFAVYQQGSMSHVEDFGCSDGLYQKLKALGVSDVVEIRRLGYAKFAKQELIELFKEFAYFDSHQASEEGEELEGKGGNADENDK